MTDDQRDPPPPSRSVAPRDRSYKLLPIVAIGYRDYLAESGETGTVQELVDRLPEMPPTIFCKLGAADFVAMLTRKYLYAHNGTWQFRYVTQERSTYTPGSTRPITRVNHAVAYFGWKHETNGRTHKIIDPVLMYGHRLDTIWPGEVTVIDDPEWRSMVKLLKWGVALRDFCAENDMEVRPMLGSIARQFLTDRRFYPDRRRKVPAKINERARDNLVGNHYFLNVIPDPSNNFTAHYLDQHRAHHYHARTTALPDSDHCYAYGRFIDLGKPSNAAAVVPDFCGLYCLDLIAPKHRPPFDWISGDLNAQFVYSCELPHLLDVGYRVHTVRAAWGSLQRDTGLPKYAAWAENQLDSHGDAPWLKPILLAAYGTLATRALNRESVFRLAKDGTPVHIMTGHYELSGLRVRSKQKLEPNTVHILQLGMIQAAERSESVGLAQWLDHLGHRVLSIYADAVVIEADDDKPFPVLPEPWRLKKTLTHLQFINQQAFTSDGMTKLPGVGREMMRYRQRTRTGRAPRIVAYEALTGKPVATDRRI